MRPEDINVQLGEGEGLQATVDLVEELGADGYIYAHGEQLGHRVEIVARIFAHAYPEVGETVLRRCPARPRARLRSCRPSSGSTVPSGCWRRPSRSYRAEQRLEQTVEVRLGVLGAQVLARL